LVAALLVRYGERYLGYTRIVGVGGVEGKVVAASKSGLRSACPQPTRRVKVLIKLSRHGCGATLNRLM
jgi:hypothetical protein